MDGREEERKKESRLNARQALRTAGYSVDAHNVEESAKKGVKKKQGNKRHKITRLLQVSRMLHAILV